MSIRRVSVPFISFNNLDGDPLENGKIYIGEANKDPEVYPITAYWDQSLSTPAAQPVRTTNGYLSQSGSPGKLYVSSDYSITVRESDDTLVYTNATTDDETDGDISFSATGAAGGTTIKTIALSDNSSAMIEIFGAGLIGSLVSVNRSIFSLHRTTGATTITRIPSEDFIDGGSNDGYFEAVQVGDDVVIKAYSNSTDWSVSGSMRVISSGTVSYS